MLDNDLEKLSAFMDSEDGAVDVVRKLHNDTDARAKWSRYHLIATALQQGLPAHRAPDFEVRVSSAIADEPTVLAPSNRADSMLKPLLGFAIAASVATLAVVGVHRLDPSQPRDVPIAETAPLSIAPVAAYARPGSSPTEPLSVSVVRWEGAQGKAADRLNGYLVNYNERRSGLAHPMLPYVRIVEYETDVRPGR